MKPKSGPVMDVQRPRPNPAPSEVTTPLDNPMSSADNIASLTPDPGQVVGQPPLATTQPLDKKPKPKRTGLIVALITIAVIVVVGAGVGGFIWYKNKNKPTPVVAPTSSESERVNVEEVDATIADIDKTLNSMNDSTDVTTGDVSDSNLGL